MGLFGRPPKRDSQISSPHGVYTPEFALASGERAVQAGDFAAAVQHFRLAADAKDPTGLFTGVAQSRSHIRSSRQIRRRGASVFPFNGEQYLQRVAIRRVQPRSSYSRASVRFSGQPKPTTSRFLQGTLRWRHKPPCVCSNSQIDSYRPVPTHSSSLIHQARRFQQLGRRPSNPPAYSSPALHRAPRLHRPGRRPSSPNPLLHRPRPPILRPSQSAFRSHRRLRSPSGGHATPADTFDHPPP